MNWGGWFKYPLVPPVLNVYKQKTRYWAGLDAMIYYYMIRICIVLINIVPGKPN